MSCHFNPKKYRVVRTINMDKSSYTTESYVTEHRKWGVFWIPFHYEIVYVKYWYGIDESKRYIFFKTIEEAQQAICEKIAHEESNL